MVGLLYYYTKAEPRGEYVPPTKEQWEDFNYLKIHESSTQTSYEEYAKTHKEAYLLEKERGYSYLLQSKLVGFENEDDLKQIKESLKKEVQNFVAYLGDPDFKLVI
jgi:hypothetical protein